MIVEQLKRNDLIFTQNHSAGNEQNSDVFTFNDRGTSLILSAPHATRSFANKKDKVADLFTGAITQYLGEENQVSTLLRVKYTPYKCLISDYVAEHNLQNHYFLDIHGFNQDIETDICLGIGEYQEQNYPYLKQIINTANKYQLKYIVNHPNYTGKFGLTGRYHKTFGQPNVIQLELKKNLRDFYQYPDVVEKITIPFLTEIINKYKNPQST